MMWVGLLRFDTTLILEEATPAISHLFAYVQCPAVFQFFSYISVTKFIRIGIADKNDNPPYFDKALYEAEVDENEDIQHTVLTVTAKDHDECK